MFKKLKREIRLKKLEIERIREIEKIRYCKAELYDIEHGTTMFSEEAIVKKYGSMAAYRQEFEDWIEESKKKFMDYVAEEERLRDS